jgi:hypothetical protein
MDSRLRLLAQTSGLCQIAKPGEFSGMYPKIIPWLGATSPPFFKAVFLILIALVIPAFFVVIWLMSRRNKDKKKAPSQKEKL